MPITFRGVTTITTINLKFRFINADHHHLWGLQGCSCTRPALCGSVDKNVGFLVLAVIVMLPCTNPSCTTAK